MRLAPSYRSIGIVSFSLDKLELVLDQRAPALVAFKLGEARGSYKAKGQYCCKAERWLVLTHDLEGPFSEYARLFYCLNLDLNVARHMVGALQDGAWRTKWWGLSLRQAQEHQSM